MKCTTKPFLRWAGGKSWFLKYLPDLLPPKFNNYYEPFLGGGSVYIFLKSNKYLSKWSFLSDVNNELINSYKAIQENPKQLYELLKTHINNKDYYYNLRSQAFEDKWQRASRFIYLNRTSFNGIYRENQLGVYNVPYGDKQYKELFNRENLIDLNQLFKRSSFNLMDFEKSIKRAKPGDLVFLDPPYTVAHENNGFIKYNQKLFSWSDQLRLQKSVLKLIKNKSHFILTNAAHESIYNLYKDHADIKVYERPSVIGGTGAIRNIYKEYIISNCK